MFDKVEDTNNIVYIVIIKHQNLWPQFINIITCRSNVLEKADSFVDLYVRHSTGCPVGARYLLNNEGHKAPAIADTVHGRYAGALFTSASKSEALQTVLSDLTHLGKVIESDENIREFLKNSAIKRTQQREVFDSFAKDNYCQITNNFIDTVIESGRLSDLPKIIQTYVKYCKILNKEEDIKVISAKELTPEERKQVIEAYKSGNPDVKFRVTYEVDHSILGGLQIYAGSSFLDCSLRSRITKLKHELAKI